MLAVKRQGSNVLKIDTALAQCYCRALWYQGTQTNTNRQSSGGRPMARLTTAQRPARKTRGKNLPPTRGKQRIPNMTKVRSVSPPSKAPPRKDGGHGKEF